MTGTEAANTATIIVGCLTICSLPWLLRWMRNSITEARAVRVEFDKTIARLERAMKEQR